MELAAYMDLRDMLDETSLQEVCLDDAEATFSDCDQNLARPLSGLVIFTSLFCYYFLTNYFFPGADQGGVRAAVQPRGQGGG